MWHYRTTRTTKSGSIARKYPRDDKSGDSSGKEERDDIEASVDGGGLQREDSNHVQYQGREADARSQVSRWWKMMSCAAFFALALLALMPSQWRMAVSGYGQQKKVTGGIVKKKEVEPAASQELTSLAQPNNGGAAHSFGETVVFFQ